MKLRLLFIAIIFCVFCNFSYGQLASWNFYTTSNPHSHSTYAGALAANMDSSNLITRGPDAAASSANNSFRTQGFQNDGISTTNEDYFQIVLSSAPGYNLSLSSINAKFAGTNSFSNSPGVTHQFAYSLDGANFTWIGSPQTMITGSVTLPQLDLTGISALQNISPSTTVTLRYYASGQTGTGGWGFNSPSSSSTDNGLSIGGSVTPAGKITTTSGDWNNPNIWSPVGVPTPGEVATIAAGHVVYTTASITRSTATNVIGTFELRNGGNVSGTSFTYNNATGTLNFNSDGNYSVSAGVPWWPNGAAVRPVNVNVLRGGLTINSTREVPGNFTTGDNLTFGVRISGSFELTVLGNLQINKGGYFNTGNSPRYGQASTLIYNVDDTYGRGFEWTHGTLVTPFALTRGYPNNVTIRNNTVLNYNNGAPAQPKAMKGNLLIESGSSLYMDYGTMSPNGSLTVGGNVTNNGNLALGIAFGDDLKLGGNFVQNGVFIPNGRAVCFIGNGTQTVSGAGVLSIPYVVIQPTAGTTNVQLLSNLNVTAPASGNAISFVGAGNTLDINGRTLTIGTSGVGNTVSGPATFRGSETSNLTLLGAGTIGDIGFTPGFQDLATFVVNRTVAATAVRLSSPLMIQTNLSLVNGSVDLGNNPLTIGATATITGASNTRYIIADVSNGANAELRKVFTSAVTTPFTFPIGDAASSADGSQYSPMSFNSSGGSYGGYIGFAVHDITEPNLDAPTNFITRYWKMTSSGVTPSSYSLAGTFLTADQNGTPSQYLSNQWNGSQWLNNGGPSATVMNITSNVIAATNHFTAGRRTADINVANGATQYPNNATYNFSDVLIGNNLAYTFTVQNLGQTTLTFSGAPVLVGSPVFSASAFGTTTLVFNASRPITITFSPTAVGTFSGSITFTTNDPDESVYVVNFTGNGIVPTPDINVRGIVGTNPTIANGDLSPSGLDNTEFAATSTPTTKTFRIENVGIANLDVSSITVTGANPGDFIVVDESPYLIAPTAGANYFDFTITFSPTTSGVRNAIININSNDPDENPYTFMVQGTGENPEIAVHGNGVEIASGSSVPALFNGTNFGNASIFGGNRVQTFTVSNYGDVTLNISSVTITGADASLFTITSTPVGVIAGESARMLVITFTPTSVGVKNALVTINNTDGNEGVYTFAIQGTAIDYIECGLGPIETIAQNTFEVTPAPLYMVYSMTKETGAGNFSEAAVNGRGQSRSSASPAYIGGRAIQAYGWSGNSSTQRAITVDFATIDASEFKDVTLNFQLGGYSTNNTQGPDAGDKVSVFVSSDNGTTWSNELSISGSNSSIWSIVSSPGSLTADFDGNNLESEFSADNGSVNTGPRNITLRNLPSSAQLKIRLVFAIDRTDEFYAVDNVILRGKKPAISTWNGTTWLPAAPTSSTVAIINGNYSAGNISACRCEVNPGFTLTVNPNQYLDVQSEIVNNGTVNVENNASIVQHNNAAVNLGSGFNIRRTTTPYYKFDYTYWSSPVASATIGATFPTWRLDYAFQFRTDLFADVLAPFDGFDDDGNAWQNVSGATTMSVGKGYAIMGNTGGTFPATASVTFSGTANNGIVTVPLQLSANNGVSNDDFNLVGNPYPSAISGLEFINQNPDFAGTIYLWTHKTQISGSAPGPDANNFITEDYAMFNSSGGTASGTGSATPTGYIASGQGFFIEAMTPGNVTFNNSMRNISYQNNNFYRLADVTSDIDRIWLNLRNETGSFSQMLLAYFDHTTLGFDRGYDGIVNKSSNSISFYTFIDSDHYRIQAKPGFEETDVTQLGYSTTAAGSYFIEISQTEGALSGRQVFMEDKVLGTIHDLTLSPYFFTTESGQFDDRFVLRYLNSTLGVNDPLTGENGLLAYAENGIVNVKSSTEAISGITIYDMLGKRIFERADIGGKEVQISNLKSAQQSLVIVVTLADDQVVRKKLIF